MKCKQYEEQSCPTDTPRKNRLSNWLTAIRLYFIGTVSARFFNFLFPPQSFFGSLLRLRLPPEELDEGFFAVVILVSSICGLGCLWILLWRVYHIVVSYYL
jgi:hypothetical protein